jgi:hypothetical protein
MIISLVMPVTPERVPEPHARLASRLRRGGGQSDPEQREHAAQDDGEDERHQWTLNRLVVGLRPSGFGPAEAEGRRLKPEGR